MKFIKFTLLKLHIICLIFVILLAGCGGGVANLHDPQSWIPPADSEKATSDWDIAEALCLKLSIGAELTKEEKEQIAFNQELMQLQANVLMDMGSSLQSFGDDSSADIAQGVGAMMMFSSMFGSATAEDNKKDKVYFDCMHGLGWSR